MIQIFDKKGFTVLKTIESDTLSDAELNGCMLVEANLVQYDLRMAQLKGADLSHADLRLARLDHADLRDADLSHADLSGADLSEARLQGAKLTGTNLSNARLPADFSRQQPGLHSLSAIRISSDNHPLKDS